MENTQESNITGNENLSETFQNELNNLRASQVLDPAYRRKKLFFWILRNLVLVLLYVLFWKYEWIKWSLYVTVPLSLVSLALIIIMPHILKQKLEKTKKMLSDLDTVTVDES